MRAALLLLAGVAAAAAPRPAPRPAFEIDPRVELLSAALLAADPAAAARLGEDQYARAAVAALAAGPGEPAVERLAALLKNGAAPEALARAVLDPSAAGEPAVKEALDAVAELGRRRRFGAFLASQRPALDAFARAARAEELDAISPAAAQSYLGRAFEQPQRFVLAPLLCASPKRPAERWRASGGWVHLRPRTASPEGGARFALDAFETSAAHALVLTALERVEPATAQMRELLAYAVEARIVALDLGEESGTRLVDRPALRGYARLREAAEGLKEYEAKARAGGLEAFLPRFVPLARLRLDEAARAVRAGRKREAGPLALAAVRAPLGPEDLRRATAILADIGEFAEARAALERLATADAALSLRVGRLYTEAGQAKNALPLLERGIAASPADADLRVALAEAAAAAGDRERALAALAAAEALKPSGDLRPRIDGVRASLAQAAEQDARLALGVAREAARSGARAEALAILEETRRRKSTPVVELADLYLELGEARTALGLLETAPAKDAGARVSLAEAAAALGDGKKAAEAIAAAEAMQPSPELRRRMAWTLWAIKERGRAAAMLDALVAEAPNDAPARVERAAMASAAGERARALDLLGAARRLEPDVPTLDRIAELLSELGRRAEAELVVEQALKAAPGDAKARLLRAKLSGKTTDRDDAMAQARGLEPAGLARFYADLGAYELALPPLEDLIRASPRDARLRVEHAFAAARAGDAVKARASLEAARALEPNDESRRRMASVYALIGERAQAAALLDELIAHWPSDPVAKIDRAAVAAETDPAGALELLESAGRLSPGPAARWSMVQVYERLGELARARSILDALLAEEPEDPRLVLGGAALDLKAGRREPAQAALAKAEKLELAGDERRRLALLYSELGDHRRAMSLLEPLTAAAPDAVDLRLDLARVAARAGERQTALRSLAAAERAARPAALADIARAYVDLDEPRRALPLFDALLRTSPRDERLLLDKADAAARAGRRDAALDALAQAAPVATGRESRRRMAIIRQDLKDYAAACELLRGLLVEKKEPAVLADLGVCEHLSGRTEQAVKRLQEAISLDPSVLSAQLTLGAIYGQLGRAEDELAVYRRAPKTGGDPALRELLEKARARAEAAARR